MDSFIYITLNINKSIIIIICLFLYNLLKSLNLLLLHFLLERESQILKTFYFG